MPSCDVDVDSILISLKYWGWFQIAQFMLANMSGLIIYSNNLMYIFMATLPDFQCSNLTDSQLAAYNISDDINEVEYSKCQVFIRQKNYQNLSAEPLTLECPNGYTYKTPFDKSIVSQWDLVCQNSGLAELSQTIYVVGQFLGAFVLPVQMEQFGRRPIHIFCNLLILPVNFLCAYSPYFWLFTITRFFNGFLIQGYLISSCTVITEMFPAQKRNLMTGLSSLIFSFTILIYELTVYLVRNKSWRILVICCASFSATGIIELIFFKESLRWLFAKGKVEKAKEMVKSIAKMNNANYDEAWKIALKEIDSKSETESTELVELHKDNDKNPDDKNPDDKNPISEEKISETKETTKLQQESTNGLVAKKDQEKKMPSKSGWIGILPIMQYSYTRKMSFVIMINWLVITITYHSFFYLSETLAGDLYLNFFILCIIEIVSCIIYWPAIVRFGHKKPLSTAIFAGSIFLIVAASLKAFEGTAGKYNTPFMIFFMLAMFGIGSAFGGLFLYSPELYPTEVRSVGFGLCAASARIGNMMAPFSRLLASHYPWAPSTLSGTGCIICAVLLFWGLPETFKKRLPQTMQELKQIQKAKRLKKQESEI